MKRASHFFPEVKAFFDDPEAEIIPKFGDYIMAYSLGTSPSFETAGTLDTVSDLIWLKCEPCDQYSDPMVPSFKSQNSLTYETYSCYSKQCRSLSFSSVGASCDIVSTCTFETGYLDGSGSNGVIAHDTLILGSTSGNKVAFPRTLFGCAHETFGRFPSDSSGIVGLGRGSISLISQISSSVQGKFSYCLTPLLKGNSVLNFGENAVVSGDGAVSTPIVLNKQPKTLYCVSLEAISVYDKRIEFSTEEGNTVVDSGTTFSMLPKDFYDKLESEVAANIELERRPYPFKYNLSLCYESQSYEIFPVPTITFHFNGENADVELSPDNSFFRASPSVVCFAFQSIPSDRALTGNTQQTNILVGYDLHNNLISFMPMDCSNQS